ncbi:MAG: DUF1045 domain-containing protein [Hyphomicrobiaceae bacterium]
MQRFAVYFAPPPNAPLWRFGCATLGYDAATGEAIEHPTELATIDADWHGLTAEPRRYGFHATLKAPFEPRAGIDFAALQAEVARLATGLASVHLDGLEVAELGRFIALIPAAPSSTLQDLAGRLVTGLDHLRAPMSEADRARRERTPLSQRQRSYLDLYGYPYVLEEYRFHMTLTGPIEDAGRRRQIRDALAAHFQHTVPHGSTVIDAVSVFSQPRRDAAFRIVSRVPLPAR